MKNIIKTTALTLALTTVSVAAFAANTVYKSEFCGCCGGYVEYMRNQGLDLEVQNMEDMDMVKQSHGVPEEMQSCHTTVLEDGRVIEGHVPLEAVQKFMADKSGKVQKISVPGMPMGVPGMGGQQMEDLVVYAFDADGKSSEYMTIKAPH